MRIVRSMLVVMAMLAPCALQASPVTPTQPKQEMTIQVASATQAPSQAPLAPLSLTALALVGATAPSKRKKMSLSRSYIFEGVTYGPGNVDVPDEFPDLDDDGHVIWPEGSAAAKNQAKARSFSSPPSTGGVNTGEGQGSSEATVSGKTSEELASMSKEDLAALASSLSITVTRSSGEGDPLKQDYVAALSATA